MEIGKWRLPQNDLSGQREHFVEFIDSFSFWIGLIALYGWLANMYIPFLLSFLLFFFLHSLHDQNFEKDKKILDESIINRIHQLVWYCLVTTTITVINPFFVFKENKSVYTASRTYRFCWQYTIILVWKTWSSYLNS